MESENPANYMYNGMKFSDASIDDDPLAYGSREFPTASSQSGASENSDDLIRQLVLNLESCSIDEQKKAAMEITLLAENKWENRIKIAKAGAIKPLISIIESSDSQLQEYGVAAIWNLSLCDENNMLIVSSGAIKPLVRALTTGTSTAVDNATSALLHLVEIEENKVAIGRSGAIELLVNLLESGAFRGKWGALMALYSLCLVEENKLRAVQAGIMKPLVELMADFGWVDKSASVLSVLVSVQEARTALVDEGGIPVLVEIIKVGSQMQKEIAVTILLQVCEDDVVYRPMVAFHKAIPPLVALSKSGTNCAKQKAETLIELLQQPISSKAASRASAQTEAEIELLRQPRSGKAAGRASAETEIEAMMFYFSLFPIGYEFERDTLVQLWIAQGFIGEDVNNRMEDIGVLHFNGFLEREYIVPSRFDHSYKQMMYKVNRDNNVFGLQELLDKSFSAAFHLVSEDSNLDNIHETTLHLSLCCKDVDQTTFDAIKKCEHLRTLLFLGGYSSLIKQVPRDLFMRVKLLVTLDLSLSHISELPSSIGNVKSLRYLDVSKTPIIWLPETLACLHNLQTLKLRECLSLLGLPEGMNELINLRHLILDIVRQLVSMPKGMGKLTHLQTLQAFLVGEDDGCCIGELKDLNNLSGTFCILQLENVLKVEEAKEASLSDKKFIEKLELQWSDLRDEKAQEEEEEVLECLRPPSNLKELKIISYGGSKLPSWIGDPSYANLDSISLHKCKNCQLFPSIGELPSLKFLYINEMNGLKEIDNKLFRNGKGQGHQAFPKLEKLVIDVMLSLEEWVEAENGDFPRLIQLTVECCPELVTLPSLCYLNSLKHLKISDCPKLPYLPKEGLPTSLEFLLIRDCPVLKERCSEEGEDWPKIAKVRSIWIDNQQMSLS